MSILKIKDNSITKAALCENSQGIINKVADKTFDELEKEGLLVFPSMLDSCDDIDRKQMVIQTVNDSYKTGNIMGFIGLGSERLIIESRFSNGNDDYFFQYLLNKVMDFPNIIDLDADASQDSKMLNLFVFLFPRYLQLALRKGIYKSYVTEKANDQNVKGVINIARHIKQNTPFIGNVAYDYRTYSYDNYITELIRHTIEYIKKKSFGNQLLSTIKEDVKIIVDATPSYSQSDKNKIIDANKCNRIKHAYYNEYGALQQLCLLILQDRKHQIGTGTQQVYGVLFDGAWLWEEYVNKLVENIFYHPMNKAGHGAQRLFENNIGLIYPDFISKLDNPRVIADAKYKPINNIGNKDYLQVLAYMFRFDAKMGLYIYPNVEKDDDLKLRLNQGNTFEKNVKVRSDTSITKCGIKIPINASSFEDFLYLIDKSENLFINYLKEELA